MKKTLAISLVFAAVSAAALAEISISGFVGAGITIVEDRADSANDLDSGGVLFGRLQAVAENEDGSFGGMIRLRAGYDEKTKIYDDLAEVIYAWAWWRPVDMLRLQIGFIDAFKVNNIVGWEFNANDSEDYYVSSAGYEYTGGILHRSTGFYNGTWWTGAALSIMPLEGLALNLAIPFGPGNWFLDQNRDEKVRSLDVFRSLHAQAVYTIDGIGRAAITYRGRDDLDTDYIEGNAPTLYGSFYLYMLEDMEFNVGVAYTFPVKLTVSADGTYNAPIAAGLGFSYSFGDFALKARFAATFAGYSTAENGDETREPFMLGFGINPSYNFDILKLFFNAGISFVGNEENASDSYGFGWHVNPYITKTIGIGTLYAGVRVESFGYKSDGDPAIEWGIPIAIQIEF